MFYHGPLGYSRCPQSGGGGGALKPKWGKRDSNINDVGPISRRYFNDKPSEEHGGCSIFECLNEFFINKCTINPGAGYDL